MTQQGDVLLFQTTDGGNIIVENGVTEMSPGLETMAYLCMFGGNEDDAGGSNRTFEWWGNKDETETAFKYRSETQNLLMSLPITSGNLLRLQDAVERDLNVFIEQKIASLVVAEVTIPDRNKIKISVRTEAEGQEQQFEFVENWRASV